MNRFNQAKAMYDYDKAIRSQVNEVCEPLHLLGISNFSYTKFTKDQKLLRLSNHQDYTDIYFRLEVFNHPNATRGLTNDGSFTQGIQTKIFIWQEKDYIVRDLRKSVNMWNGVTIYKTGEDYIEAWALGGTLEDSGIQNFIINNMDVLHRFFNYFRIKAKDLIDTTEKRKLVEVIFNEPLVDPLLADKLQMEEFLKRITAHKYILSAGQTKFTLTLREIECLLHRNNGLTSKEIARVLAISHRTVESYLENIKIKSGLDNLNQVLAICRDEGLM